MKKKFKKQFWHYFFLCLLLNISNPVEAEGQYDYTIKINFTNFTLCLDSAGITIKQYRVALPKIKLELPIVGEVQVIEIKPCWYPTSKTRKDYFLKYKKELPAEILPGGQLNAMGAAKININFLSFPKGMPPTIKIHGTNQPGSIGKRVSRGCIRMLNRDIKELTSLIKGKKTKVVFCQQEGKTNSP